MAAEPAIDLLRLFVPATCRDEVSGAAGGGPGTGAGAEAIELSLDLSLGGERREKRLVRSSTVAAVGLTMFVGEELRGVGRTYSLPAEAEEEVRKRKEIQGMKRMEAKRRRLVKRESRSGSGSGSGSRSGSQGSGSSVLSDLESLPTQGLRSSKEVKSPSPVLDLANHRAATPPTIVAGKHVKPSNEADNPPSEMEKKMLESMPCVSTRGEGPNGKRIHGFLYKYGKDEEVRILCVCHGIFLTPAEFVKHAGGGDVANPLRHIVVSSPSPSAIL